MAFPIRIIYRLPEIEFHCVIGRRYTKSMISFLLPCETRFLKIYIRKQMTGGDWLTESLEKTLRRKVEPYETYETYHF